MLPNMKYGARYGKAKQVKFGGLNHTVGAGDGAIWDMQNMTGDHYPVLATRERRHLFCKLEKPGGIFAWDKLCWVDGTQFIYDGEVKGEVTEGLKTFASIGRFVVIFPDKCFYNMDTDTFGSLEARWQSEKLTFGNGLLYGEEADANMIRCEGVNWSDFFREGDAVTISGCKIHPENNKTAIVRQIDGDKMYFYEFVFSLEADEEYEEVGDLLLARTVPDLKFLWENENRLWGCTDRTIYSSKRDDIFNWNVYDGIESDAWAIEPAAAGDFTGGIAYKGYAIPFKEDRIFKVYGYTPSTFKAMGSASMGIPEGSGGSLAVAGEVLFYLSRSGITAYSGGIPQPIGEAFGMERFQNAVGGSDGLKYYVSMQGEDGDWWLYVYDTQKGLWHKEDKLHVTHFTNHDGGLYMLTDTGEVWVIGSAPEGTQREDAFEWFVEFADFTENDPNRKGMGRLQLRLELEEDACMDVLVQFDSDGIWHNVKHLHGEGEKKSFYLPIVPMRCDHYRVKLSGTGMCRVYSLVREVYSGSEIK